MIPATPDADHDHDHIVDTGKGSFPLSRLGPLLPGMAEMMLLVGERAGRCWHAAVARNRRLAVFQLRETVVLLRKATVLRPKYAETVDGFITNEVEPVRRALEAEDWEGFEAAFAAMVDRANYWHDHYGKPFLHWRVPARPPADLDLRAGMEG